MKRALLNFKKMAVLALCLMPVWSSALAAPDAASLLSAAAGQLSRCAGVRVESTVTMGIEGILPSGVYATATVEMLRDPLRIKAAGASREEEAEAYLRQEGDGLALRVYAGGRWSGSTLALDADAALKALESVDLADAARFAGTRVSVAEPIGGVDAYMLEAAVDLRGLMGEEVVGIALRAVLGEQANMRALPPEWRAEAEIALYVEQATGRPLRIVADLSKAASDAAARLMPITPGAPAQPLRIELVMEADFVQYDAVPDFEWPQIPA